MSYLDSPRLHFFGEFIAEPSTINNSEVNFDGPIQDPGWNPNGNHRFAFTGTTITSLVKSGALVTSGDPLIGKAVNTVGSPFAKLVDLDVEVQIASKVIGLQISFGDGAGNSLTGTMTTAAFRDFSGARLLGVYQSTLTNLQWTASGGSWLATLKAASPTLLSIRFIVDFYTGMSGGPHRGRLAGAIGPATAYEPPHCIAGRRIVGVNGPSALALLSKDALALDIGNVVPGNTGSFSLPTLTVAVQSDSTGEVELKTGAAPFTPQPLPPGWRQLGVIDTTLDRYKLTSGVESLKLSKDDAALAASARLGLFTPSGATLATEDEQGVFVFADQRAFPMNPGDKAPVVLTALTFGQPGAPLQLDLEATLNAGAAGLSFPASVTTDAKGKATVSFEASDPGTPRGPVDGQVFAVGGNWADRSAILIPGTGGAIAVRVFSGFTAPASPTWADVQPILVQYNTMYPSMAAIIDLSDLNAVKGARAEIKARLLLPYDDPGHMPVTRDLSAQKRAMIVAWIDAGCPE